MSYYVDTSPSPFGEVDGEYPVTITTARYGGSYEGGRWLAFPCDPGGLDRLCPGWDDSDVECMKFWAKADTERWPIGRGTGPSAAWNDMRARLYRLADGGGGQR